jgi:hypothetical protein
MEDSRPTVQRTLVKSPPELWADLSNPESLARRLGEFGEILITRLVPEKTVAWEGERASGTVEIEASGWGTKVRLSAKATVPANEEEMVTDEDLERELALEASVRAEIEREAAIEAALLAEIQEEAEIEAALRAQAEAEADAEGARQRQAEAARQAAAGRPAARPVVDEASRGFFSRFRKRRKSDPSQPATPSRAQAARVSGAPTTASPDAGSSSTGPTGASSAQAGQTGASSPQADPTAAARQPTRPVAAGHRPPVRLSALAFAPAHETERPPAVTTTTAEFDKPGAETITASRHPRSKIPAKPALDDEETLAVLAGVLDDLGAAHHRPFSRD